MIRIRPITMILILGMIFATIVDRIKTLYVGGIIIAIVIAIIVIAVITNTILLISFYKLISEKKHI